MLQSSSAVAAVAVKQIEIAICLNTMFKGNRPQNMPIDESGIGKFPALPRFLKNHPKTPRPPAQASQVTAKIPHLKLIIIRTAKMWARYQLTRGHRAWARKKRNYDVDAQEQVREGLVPDGPIRTG